MLFKIQAATYNSFCSNLQLLLTQMTFLANAIWTKVPPQPRSTGHELKLSFQKILRKARQECANDTDIMHHISDASIDAIKCSPKLTVHDRIYTKKYTENAKARSATKKMKSSGESDMSTKINRITEEQNEKNEEIELRTGSESLESTILPQNKDFLKVR